MKYEVPIVYRGQCNFIVDANSTGQAQLIAEKLFRNGHEPDALGNEWEELEQVGEPLLLDPATETE